MPPKSIWRQPNAQHFAVVHRSQQDPLIHDPEAGSHVLTPRSNQQSRKRKDGAESVAAGKTRAQLERELGTAVQGIRSNVGEAAKYGIYYDDSEYDYMQHLRVIGGGHNQKRGGADEEDDTEVIMLEAPGSKNKGKAAAGSKGLQFREDVESSQLNLPPEALPSQKLMQRTYTDAQAIQDGVKGFQPDMDPHLRQVLEALEDDAFLIETARSGVEGGEGAASGAAADVEEGVEEFEETDGDDIDAFFGDVIAGGEAEDEDDLDWRQLPPEGEESIWEDPAAKAARELLRLKQEGKGAGDLSLEARMALFKAAQAQGRSGASFQGQALRNGDDGEDDDADTAGAGSEDGTASQAPSRMAPSSVGSKSIFGEKSNRRSRVPGAKARLAASYYAPSAQGGATAFSMSSSAMFRNEGLTSLDERFEKLERVYEGESDEEDEPPSLDDLDPEVPQSELSRADFDGILDEFLDKHEVYGGKLRERLGARDATPLDKVAMIRDGLGKAHITEDTLLDEEDDQSDILMPRERGENREKWDVETVLTTHSNLSNHPRMISAKESVAASNATSRRPATLASGATTRLTAMGSVVASVGPDGEARIPKIKIDPRTGMPKVVGYVKQRPTTLDEDASTTGSQGSTSAASGAGSAKDAEGADEDEEEDESDYDSDATEGPRNVTVARDRNESKEDKKARKAAAKEAKQLRREEKALRKATYANERKKQLKARGARLAGGAAADVAHNGTGRASAVLL